MELIVVDDHSTDSTCDLAAGFPVRLHHLEEGRRGAAAARNKGALEARAPVLVFLDADVIVEPDCIRRLLEALNSGADAAVGAYQPCPSRMGLWSMVKDLSVRLNHARAGREIRWFWTAVSAVRGQLFQELGGFDEGFFAGATVEDMEFGFRLSQRNGRILQVSEASALHLHRFTLYGLMRNDFRKSRDWMRMVRRHGREFTQGHGAVASREGWGLMASMLTLAGLVLAIVNPLLSGALCLSGVSSMAWLLRSDLKTAVSEGGTPRALAYLVTRMLLYPVAAAGAATGVILESLTHLRKAGNAGSSQRRHS